MNQGANNGSSDVQPPAPGMPAADQLPDAVTEKELMTSGHKPHESYTCLLCCLPIALPKGTFSRHWQFRFCCMKTACDGCRRASSQHGMWRCAFCRTDTTLALDSSDVGELWLACIQNRVDANDPKATELLADGYYFGDYGLQPDIPRAIELWTEAARLGDLSAHCKLGYRYCKGSC